MKNKHGIKVEPKCYNCKFAGERFKIGKLTHLHCWHPKFDERRNKGGLSAWETLCVFSETCNDHEFKD